jgi:hypothetical protein
LLASARVTARPIPDPAPVTTATMSVAMATLPLALLAILERASYHIASMTSTSSRGGHKRSPRPRLAALRRRWRDPALTLLTLLLAAQMFVIHPLTVVSHSPLLAIPLLAPLLVIAVIVVSDHLITVLIVLAGVGMTTVASVLHLSGNATSSFLLHLVAGLVVTCALLWVVAKAVYAPGRISFHRITGTFLLYLIIGAIFSAVYGIIDLLAAHAFRGMAPANHAGAVVDQALYFSFSTLTTAGFGDIVPSDALTRGLSNLEAIIGQLFPATVIARMMTLRMARYAEKRPPPV